VTKEVAESIGLGKASGALVRSVEPGLPADKAGVEAGDIITKVDGKPVEKVGDLPRMVSNAKPGGKVVLQVFRRGAYRDLTVSVVEFEAEHAAASAVPHDAPKPPAALATWGLVVADLTDAQRRELKVKGGVRIESAEGASAKAGLHEGDVLLTVDNTEVTSAKQFESLAAKTDKSRAVTVLVRRADIVNFVIIRPAH
jgi:serine protease Do